MDEQREGAKGGKEPLLCEQLLYHHQWDFHTKPFLEAIEQIGADRVLFSVDYPYEQMDMGARWFDDLRLTNALKTQVGRRNADRLFRLKLATLSDDAAAGFAS